jgi:acetate---CoA ligase (ADP-forming) subunit beta
MTAWTETRTKQALGELPMPRELLTADLDEAMAFARDLGGPVVAKASGVAHKSDGDLVRLGLRPGDLPGVFQRLASAGDGDVLVAEQIVDAELELIVGGLRDPQFGPVVAVGIGGIAAEIFDDVTFVLSPSTVDELDRALAQLAGVALLEGVRGRPPVDRERLFAVVDAVGGFLEREPAVSEVDCNPVMVRRGIPIVVDALAKEGTP